MFEAYNDLLTVEEMCEALFIGKNSAYKLLNSGEVKGFRISRTWKVPRISIEEYVMKMKELR